VSIPNLQAIQQNFALMALPSAGSSKASSASTVNADLFARLLSAQTTAPAASGTTSGQDIASAAEKYLGVPYVLGGEDASGIDCSGLVQRSLADMGIDAPRLVSGQSRIGTEVPSLAQAKPGDLIVLNGGEHIAIYVGDGKVIHAPEPGRKVEIKPVWFDDSEIVTIRRVAPEAAPTPVVDSATITSLLSGMAQLSLGSTSSGGVAASLNELIAAQSALLTRSAL
jgi:hypothetical protein